MQGAARYVIWSYIFRDVDHAKVLDHLKGSGLLRRDADGRVLVLGLSAKVGDNLFSVDRRGEGASTVRRHPWPPRLLCEPTHTGCSGHRSRLRRSTSRGRLDDQPDMGEGR